MDRNRSQMLLMTTERFGILLAESMMVGSPPQIVPSVNIGTMLARRKTNSSNNFIVFSAQLLSGRTAKNVTSNAAQFNTPNSIFIPALFIQQRSNTTGIFFVQ